MAKIKLFLGNTLVQFRSGDSILGFWVKKNSSGLNPQIQPRIRSLTGIPVYFCSVDLFLKFRSQVKKLTSWRKKASWVEYHTKLSVIDNSISSLDIPRQDIDVESANRQCETTSVRHQVVLVRKLQFVGCWSNSSYRIFCEYLPKEPIRLYWSNHIIASH